jgi:hypothetical protein
MQFTSVQDAGQRLFVVPPPPRLLLAVDSLTYGLAERVAMPTKRRGV